MSGDGDIDFDIDLERDRLGDLLQYRLIITKLLFKLKKMGDISYKA